MCHFSVDFDLTPGISYRPECDELCCLSSAQHNLTRKKRKKHQVRCHLVSEIRTHNKFNGGGGGGGGERRKRR